MSKNRFSPETFHDFTIVDQNNLVVVHVRIKPSGIHWSHSNAKKWYGVAACADYHFHNSDGSPDLTEEINRVMPQAPSDVMTILDNVLKAAKKAEYYFDITQ